VLGPAGTRLDEQIGQRLRVGEAGRAAGVDPGQQHRLGVGLDAEVLPLLDRLEAEAVEQLQHGRLETATGAQRDRLPGVDDPVERAHHGERHPGHRRAQP
jgi:hypothetical protein